MRQFLAIELSREQRDELSALRGELQRDLRGWRWVKPENIHLTLRFLGEVPSDLDARCREAWRAVATASAPFAIQLSGIGSFPPRGRPRVFWVGVREQGGTDRLATLASAFETAARESGFEPETRPFRPHLTLARARRGQRATVPERSEFESPTVLQVERAVLFRSELHPTGARYSVLENLTLGID